MMTSPNSNFSNTASLLWHAYHSLPSPSSSVNWAGFYFTSPTNASQLLLGPFQGQVACQTINFGRGVCGTAAKQAKTQLVEDVEQFPGHIACDGKSRSEIVVPIVQGGKVCFETLVEKGRSSNVLLGCGDYRYRLCRTERV
jgi:L-methionine (R)-S-oxide reductase